jgi:hypothetical protein
MRFPVVKGPLGCKRLRQGDVLPDIAEVSEVRVRQCADESTVAFRLSTPAGELRIRVGSVPPGQGEAHVKRRRVRSGVPVEEDFRRRSVWRRGEVDAGHVENPTAKPRHEIGIIGREVDEGLLHIALEPHE